MDLKVGIFGPDAIVAQAEKAFATDHHVETLSFAFQTPEEIEKLIDQAFMSDVYIFLDPFSYYYSRETINKKRLPVVKTLKDEYALASTFYQLIEKDNLSLKRFSIDIGNKKYVENILHDFGIDHDSIHIVDYLEKSNLSIEKIVNFHFDLWKNEEIDFVLTASQAVYEQLMSENIPVRRIDIPNRYFFDCIKQAKELIHFNEHSIKRLVTGYIQLQPKTKDMPLKEKTFTSVHRFLKDFQSKLNTSLVTDGKNQFILTGTQKFLSYLTSHLRSLPLINDLKERLPKDINVHIGFGYGLTAQEAEQHAKTALKQSVKSKGSSCYIVNEREEVIGPIGIRRSFNKPKLYNKLIHNARLNNQISYNFIQFISARNNEPFSSEDIAQFYKVTKRSAERTIKKLVNGNVIIHVGEERPYVKGRPRKLFQLNDEILN